MHAMVPCHGGIGCPLGTDTNLNRKAPETTEIENTHGFDATIALNEPEEAGHPDSPDYITHTKLTTLTRELDDLHQ